MARRHPRAAVHGDRSHRPEAQRLEPRSQRLGIQEHTTGCGEVAHERERHRAGDVPEPLVDGVRLTPVPLGGSGVEHEGGRVGRECGDLVDADDAVRRPGDRRRRVDRLGMPSPLLERSAPRPDPAVEHGGGATEHVEHPPQPGGHRPAGVVVGDDGCALADAEPPERRGEGRRIGQRVASARCSRRAGEVVVERGEHGARDVAREVGVMTRPTVEVRADVDDDHVAEVHRQPGGVDERPGEQAVHRCGVHPERFARSRRSRPHVGSPAGTERAEVRR